MSAYRAAIDLTVTAIDQRSRIFRNQVLAIVVVILTPIVAAMVLHQLWLLTALLALAPVCGLFVWVDVRQVARWRSTIFDSWARRDIDLLPFSRAMQANKMLPVVTLNSMLECLRMSEIANSEGKASAETRKAVTAVLKLADVCNVRQVGIKVWAAAIVSTGACWCAAIGAWLPLIFTALILPLPFILWCLQVSLERQSTLAVRAVYQDPGFDSETFDDLLNYLSPRDAGVLTGFLTSRKGKHRHAA